MVWVGLGSVVVVVFGWVISVAIVLRVRRLHDVDAALGLAMEVVEVGVLVACIDVVAQ